MEEPATPLLLHKIARHRKRVPSRRSAPLDGWATLALAGFLARGSLHFVQPSQFPSGIN